MKKINSIEEKEVEVKMTLVVRKDFDTEQILRRAMERTVDATLGIRDFEIKEIKDL